MEGTIANQSEDLAARHIRNYEQLRAIRGTWEAQWNDISKIVTPNDLNSFQGTRITEGDKRTKYLYDSTAHTALMRFVAIIDSMMTPHNAKWHRMTTDDETLKRNKQVQEYFEKVSLIMFRERYHPNANFLEQNQNVWSSLGAYGNGALFIDSLWGTKGLRYKFAHLGEIYHESNHQGIPDKVYRHFRLRARQAVRWFPDTCPEVIKRMAETQPENQYEFLHCVVPNDEYEPGRFDAKGMKFSSHYISLTGNAVLQSGGYRSFPYAITKWGQSLNEEYGRGPIGDVLPNIKTLNEEKRILLKQAHRIVDPVYLVHDDGILNTMSAQPGAMVAGGISPEGRRLVDTLPTGNVQIGKDIMDDDRNDIKDAMYTSLFQILVENPEMTATEVMERTKEKGMLIAPLFGRQESYLSRVITREYDLLENQGAFGPMPLILKEAKARGKGAFSIRFESPLAKMRRADEAAGFMRMLGEAVQVYQATQDPSSLFHFNMDVAIPELAEIHGVPARWMKSLDEVNKLRENMQAQQQQQAAIQAGPSIAAVMKAQQQR